MNTNDLRLSGKLILKLREYNLNSNQMIAFALNLSRHFDINKLAALMHITDQISFNFDQSTQTFELIDPEGLMGNVNKVIRLEN